MPDRPDPENPPIPATDLTGTLATPTPAPAVDEADPEEFRGRFSLHGRSLRQHAARGTLINSGFDIALSSLGVVKGFVVAAFLTPDQYGVWGLIVVTGITLAALKDIGIGDKYIQQDEQDQELAWQKAFSLELIVSGLFIVVMLAVLPLLVAVYSTTELVAPWLVACLLIPAGVLQAPVWVYYRRMAFVRQRALLAVDPLVTFAVSVTLAAQGLGMWSLLLGGLAGSWTAALVALRFAPYPLRFRYDRGTLGSYASFSWPLFVAQAGRLVLAQGSVIAAARYTGLAGVGVVALASSISQFTDRVDAIITATLYPAICAVRDRMDLLFESFVKSNRLTLMWGMPFGVGLTLFGPDLTHFLLGPRWIPATTMIQVFGLAAAFNHVGFNWGAYFRASGNTRPIAVNSVAVAGVFLVVMVPLIARHGLEGFAIGIAVVTAVTLAIRAWFLVRLFSGFRPLRHLTRALAPTVPAVGAVMGVRLLESGGRSPELALIELLVYAAVTAAATLLLERPLLSEAIGYLRRSRSYVPAG